MSKLSKRLLDDNEKLATIVRKLMQKLFAQIIESHNVMASSKDNLESCFHLVYQKHPKVQRTVAQIGRTHISIVFQRCHMLKGELEYINVETTMLALIIKKNFKEVGA